MPGARIAALFVAVLVAVPSARQAGQTTPPQQPSLTFRATANYVEIDAIVTDRTGAIVKDLTTADFEVSEDGRAQALTVCSFVDIPVERPDPLLVRDGIIEPDVISNEKAFDGRVFMIVFDGYHISSLRSAAVRNEALKFIDQYMGENDIATVVQIGSPAAGQEFTGRKSLLKDAVRRFTGQSLRSVSATVNADALQKGDERAEGFEPGAPRDVDAPVREFMARQSLDSLRRLSEYMGQLGGRRKALLLFSEGISIDMMPPVQLIGPNAPPQPQVTELRLAQRAMVGAATRSNVSIYTIDPRGLQSGMEESTLIGMTPSMVEGGASGANLGAQFVGGLQDEFRRSQDSLREYADATGGRAIVDHNDMNAAFDRIVKDNSSYYLLGYHSPDPSHDGKFHRVSVKVRRPGLEVRTRNGYFAPSAKSSESTKPSDPVVGMLRSPAAVRGLGMRASAAVMKGLLNKSTVHLTVEFNGRDLPLKSEARVQTNQIAIEYIALDAKGEIQANVRENVDIRLAQKYQASYAENGIRYMNEFEVAPGRYQLRIAARESLTGRAGSVFVDLDVPDLATLPFAMGDILLTSSRADETATGKSTPAFGRLLPSPPVMTRTFSRDETLTALAAFYDNVLEPKHRVDLKATLQSDTGAEAFKREETRESPELNSAKGGYRWQVSVPLASLAPGRYVLVLEGRSWLGDQPTTKREIEFRVR